LPLELKKFQGEPEKIDITREINDHNRELWDNKRRQISYYSQMGGEIVNKKVITTILAELDKRDGIPMRPEEKEAVAAYNHGRTYIDSSYREMKDLFSIAAKKAEESDHPEQLKVIEGFYKDIAQDVEKINKNKDDYNNIILMKDILDQGVEVLNRLAPPEIIKPLNEFAEKKSAQTFANVAFKSYDQFRDSSPIISIENPPAGQNALSTGEELKQLVTDARKEFVKQATSNLGISEKEAEKTAEKLIGVTWDVGHINMLRKYGYEGKDIAEQTEPIKKLVKHVHLSDNFGLEHTELPMGMGNVPIKDIMDRLGNEGFNAKKIIEAGSWWVQFKTPPVKETLEAFGSPIYAMNMAPYWNQTAGLQQGYFGGYGEMLPQVNYETMGAGFSQLPPELGGQRRGAQGSRMSGRNME
jgi:hypothetical protein